MFQDIYMLITSLQNATVKELVRLKNKKDRDQSAQFLVEGEHLIQEASKAGLLKEIFCLENFQKTCEDTYNCLVTACTQSVLNKISSQKSDASMIGLCKKPEIESSLAKKVLILDHVQDPGNVGTLIRSAYAFGADQVCLSPDCADPYQPKALQSTQGAIFHLSVLTNDLSEIIRHLQKQNIPVLAAALHQQAVELHSLQVPEKYGLMIGNEGQGIRQELIDQADQCVYIEMQNFESLNAAVAGSILLYAFQFKDSSR